MYLPQSLLNQLQFWHHASYMCTWLSIASILTSLLAETSLAESVCGQPPLATLAKLVVKLTYIHDIRPEPGPDPCRLLVQAQQ